MGRKDFRLQKSFEKVWVSLMGNLRVKMICERSFVKLLESNIFVLFSCLRFIQGENRFNF